jgi:hypothetical protein
MSTLAMLMLGVGLASQLWGKLFSAAGHRLRCAAITPRIMCAADDPAKAG